MVFVNIAAIVVAAAVVVLVFFLVPLIRELKATVMSVREIAFRLENDIQSTLKDLNEVIADVSVITEGAAENAENIKIFMSAVGDTGRGIRAIGALVGGATTALTKSSLWLTGARVAGSYLMEKLTKQRG